MGPKARGSVVTVAENPGAVVTGIVLRLAARGMVARPRMDMDGTHVPLVGSGLRGATEVVVAADEGGSRVALLGTPPRWPFRIGWERRTLRRLLGRQPLSVSSPRPSSGG